ncbi:MAG: BrnT family toxin [Actinomycetota bacterium]|nr:BrnT family toxin [Actinomycetota bacterium]
MRGEAQYTFEFDEAKSRANKSKHGIDFLQAQVMWLDGDLLRLSTRSDVEPRFLFIGTIGGKHWSAIATYRGETIRLISVRRSRVREVQAYEGE